LVSSQLTNLRLTGIFQLCWTSANFLGMSRSGFTKLNKTAIQIYKTAVQIYKTAIHIIKTAVQIYKTAIHVR